jgi:hypothetical protein
MDAWSERRNASEAVEACAADSVRRQIVVRAHSAGYSPAHVGRRTPTGPQDDGLAEDMALASGRAVS